MAIAVFGPDDRTPLPERLKNLEDKIGLIYEPRSRSVCTAFCIDETTIATAAHCLFRTQGERPLPLNAITFRLASEGVRRRTPLAGAHQGAAAQHIVAGSTSLSTRPPIDATRDWALLRLSKPACRKGGLPLNATAPRDLAARDRERSVYQVGFHGDFGAWKLTYSPPCHIRQPATTAEARATSRDFSDAHALILHTCDTGGASSGSPMLIDGRNGPEVVGINVGTYMQSRILTQAGEVVHRYKSDTVANTAVSTLAFLPHRAAFAQAGVLVSARDITRLQTRLSETGHYRGQIDGKYGPRLRQAIRAYEESVRLLPTGIASSALLSRLEADFQRNIAEPAPDPARRIIETGSVNHPAAGTAPRASPPSQPPTAQND